MNVKINTDELIAVSDKIIAIINSILGSLETLKSGFETSSWEGSLKEEFIKKYKDYIVSFSDDLIGYGLFINNYILSVAVEIGAADKVVMDSILYVPSSSHDSYKIEHEVFDIEED